MTGHRLLPEGCRVAGCIHPGNPQPATGLRTQPLQPSATLQPHGTVAPPLPIGPFDLIYADPGLIFRGWSHKGEGRSPQAHYRCEPVEAACALPVAMIAAPDAILAIWVYGPRLPDTLAIITAWGFTYIGKGFCWEKITATGQPRIGLGHTTRKVTEDCLLAKRGRGLKRRDRGVSELIRAPRLNPTGRKPDETRHRLERLYGDARRIELYARGAAPAGWTFWGDQAVHDPKERTND